MQKMVVKKISEVEARGVFNRLLRDHSDKLLKRLFKDAFVCEFDRIILPENERNYYIESV